MKKLIILILLTSIAFSACTDYINLAEQRLTPPYPSYFGAAGEYIHAADCYNTEKDYAKSDFYYAMAGDYYVTAAESLIIGGDNFLRARAYENAASAYAKVEMNEKAVKYYEEARNIFNNYGYDGEGIRITGLIISLNSVPPKSLNFVNVIGIISLVSLITSLLALLYLFIQNAELKEILANIKPKKRTKKPEIVKRKSSHFMSPEKPRQKVREIKIDPKEKFAKKLREKYMPK